MRSGPLDGIDAELERGMIPCLDFGNNPLVRPEDRFAWPERVRELGVLAEEDGGDPQADRRLRGARRRCRENSDRQRQDSPPPACIPSPEGVAHSREEESRISVLQRKSDPRRGSTWR